MSDRERPIMASIPTGAGHDGKWPRDLFEATVRQFSIEHLYHLKRKGSDGDYLPEDALMGHVLPPFQRPLVWDEGRMVRFVESAILGLHLGVWVYNDASDEMDTVDGRLVRHETDRWLIDGQQRLTALDRFFDDEFPVFGARFSEVTDRERSRLLRRQFAAIKLNETNVHVLAEIYDRLAFGGIAHTPDQRAVVDEPEPTSTPTFRF